MPGLNLMGGASANAGGFSPTVDANASATAKGFGPGYTQVGSPNRLSALTPNDPFGVTFWAGVIATGLLIFLRHSLPG